MMTRTEYLEEKGDASNCPMCGEGGVVTHRTTSIKEAECPSQDCSVVVFEVSDAD